VAEARWAARFMLTEFRHKKQIITQIPRLSIFITTISHFNYQYTTILPQAAYALHMPTIEFSGDKVFFSLRTINEM